MPTSDRGALLWRPLRQLSGNQSLWVPGEGWLQSWNLKELTEGHHQEWSLRLNLTQHGQSHPARTQCGWTDWTTCLDSVGGRAVPNLLDNLHLSVTHSLKEQPLPLDGIARKHLVSMQLPEWALYVLVSLLLPSALAMSSQWPIVWFWIHRIIKNCRELLANGLTTVTELN